MNDKRLTVCSFKSYVGFDDDGLNTSNDESFSEQLNTRILPGEMVIAEAQNVLLFAPVSENKQGKSGVLIVTNFKLSFVTTDERLKDEMTCQENSLLGEYDVCLSNVDVLYQLGEKRRRLLPGKNISEKVKGLHVVCKNMRVLTFSFKFSPVGHGKTLTNALLHHAFPRRHQLLFAYDFREPYYSCPRETPMFRDAGEWGRELARTGCIGWRLSGCNKNFDMSPSLPEWLVIPSSVVDCQLGESARHFRAGRPPIWCWSSPNGAALVRMADILPTITDGVQENKMLETIRRSHPKRTKPYVIDLTKDLPSPRDIQYSFSKLRELCAPESEKQFWVQDNNFLSLIESTRWLHGVSSCLSKAMEASELLNNDVTVVLREGDGRDLSPIVASLTQMLVDSYYRTIIGFQSLIQREWVAMGHPFCSRLGHVYNSESQQAPVFLLFLDCVWQLLQQFPTEFQMTETYLTTLWDSCHLSIFDTFLFDCERDRFNSVKEPNNPLTLRSVWDWGEQFPDRDIVLFNNPLYQMLPSSSNHYPDHHAPLLAATGISVLQFWSQCYFRFIPMIEIIGGGKPQIDLASRMLLSQLDTSTDDISMPVQSSIAAPTLESLSQIGSFFPFSRRPNAGPVTAAFLINSSSLLNQSFLSNEMMLDSQSILNEPD